MRIKKQPLSEMEKLAKKIGSDGEDVLKELEAMDVTDLNKRIAQANQSISDTKTELDENEKYESAKLAVKDLSSGFREVKKRQNAIIAVAVKLRKEKGGGLMEITLKEVEVAKLDLKPGDKLVITIKSDGVDSSILEKFREVMKPHFPQNEVLIIGVGLNNEVNFSILDDSQAMGCGSQSYCEDCDCGKKERVEKD